MIQTNFIDMENMFDLLKEETEVSEERGVGLGGVRGTAWWYLWCLEDTRPVTAPHRGDTLPGEGPSWRGAHSLPEGPD